MVTMTHPTFPDCCTPWGRTTPSGRVEWVHRFSCKVNPNQPLERRPLPRRAETASRAVHHDWDTCTNDDCLECGYIDAHLDRDDDEWTG